MPEVPTTNDVSGRSGPLAARIELPTAPAPAIERAVSPVPSLRRAPPIGDDEVVARVAAAAAVHAEVRSALARDDRALRMLVEAVDGMDGRAARLWVRKDDGGALDVDACVARVLAVALPMRRAALGELLTGVCERSLEVAGDALAASELDALLARVAGWVRLAGV